MNEICCVLTGYILWITLISFWLSTLQQYFCRKCAVINAKEALFKLKYSGVKLCAVCQRDNKTTKKSAASTPRVQQYHSTQDTKAISRSHILYFVLTLLETFKYHTEFATYIHQILNFSVQNYTYNTLLTMFYITKTEPSITTSYGNLSFVITVLVIFPPF